MQEDRYYKERLEEAKKRVAEMKGFHNHLYTYIIINILLLLIRGEFLGFLMDDNRALDPNFLHWIDLNVILTPLLWGIGLFIHGIYAYRHKFQFFKNWEQRQIEKYLREEEESPSRYE